MTDAREAKADVGALRRRGRRRLVGAIALVLLAVIVLPMVFDPAPKPSAPPVSVRIPSEDGAEFKPRVTPKESGPASIPQKAPAAAAAPGQGAAPEVKPPSTAPTKPVEKPLVGAQDQAATKAAPRPPERPDTPPPGKPAPAAPPAEGGGERKRAEDALAGTRYIIPVVALASPEKLKELLDLLRAAQVPHYTEQIPTAKGPVTRVRAGPFDSQKAAEQTLEKLKGLGLKPGGVTTKS